MRDLILTVCTVAFGYALIPQVIYGFRAKLETVTAQTSVITGLGLYAIAGVYFSLSLWFAAFACTVTGTLWMVLLLQRVMYGKVGATLKDNPEPSDQAAQGESKRQ